MKKMNKKQNNTEIFSGKIGRIVVIVLVLILLTQVVFFYCLLCQYDTYGEPGYTYHVSYEEWMQVIALAILVFLFANRSTLLGCTKCTGQGRA